MSYRTIQKQSGSYITVLPKDLIEALGWEEGDKIAFRTENEKIIMTPVHPAGKLNVQAAAHEPDKVGECHAKL